MGITRRLLIALSALSLLAVACRADNTETDVPDCGDDCTQTAVATTRASTTDLTATPEISIPTTAPFQPIATADGSGGACTATNPHAAGNSDGALVAGGLERTYLLHIPPAYDGRVAMPLVVNLHGFGSSASDQTLYSRFNQLADSQGFIVVAPNGSGYPERWTFPGLGGVDDVAFIGELIDELAAALCIDESRVYAAGMSNGAAISTFIACGLPGRIAAIGAVGATAGPRTCPDALTVPVITFRGTEDACVPYEGGTSSCGMMLPVASAEEVARLWGEHNGCGAMPVTADVSEHVRTTAYVDCVNDAEAILYTIEGGGHTWPGSINVPRLGLVTNEVDATALIWEFFERHSTP